MGDGVVVGEARGCGIGMESPQEVTSTATPTMMGRTFLAILTKSLARNGCIFIPLRMRLL